MLALWSVSNHEFNRTMNLALFFKLRGINLTISARRNGSHAIGWVQFIKVGYRIYILGVLRKLIITRWEIRCVSAFFIGKTNHKRSRPFDRDRDGRFHAGFSNCNLRKHESQRKPGALF